MCFNTSKECLIIWTRQAVVKLFKCYSYGQQFTKCKISSSTEGSGRGEKYWKVSLPFETHAEALFTCQHKSVYGCLQRKISKSLYHSAANKSAVIRSDVLDPAVRSNPRLFWLAKTAPSENCSNQDYKKLVVKTHLGNVENSLNKFQQTEKKSSKVELIWIGVAVNWKSNIAW